MKTSGNPLRLAGLITAAALAASGTTAGSAAARAQDGALPCSAFARNDYGGWRVMAPVTFAIGNTLYSPMVGTTFPAGATEHGIEMSDLLDQQCGNR